MTEQNENTEDYNRLMQQRLEKLAKIKEKGINPYPYRYTQDKYSVDLHKKYENLEKEDASPDYYHIAGRIMLLRKLGKVAFISLQDQKGRIQLMLRSNVLKNYDILDLLDVGDIIGAYGNVIRTKTGELSINVEKLDLLSKSIRPMPEKYHGLKDTELRYRMRYLDLIMNPEIKETFIKYSKMYDSFRKSLNAQNFIEMHTPILQPMYGGANARPFISHLNALDMDVYLRISNELYLKRLLVGGFERVYEFARDFRNEGVDKTHNPEFTQIEIYQAYADYNDMMRLTEQLVSQAAIDLNGTTKAKFGECEIDFAPPWRRISMKDAIKEYADIDIDALSNEQLMDLVDQHALEIEGNYTEGKIVSALFEKYCEEKLIQPTFVIQHPIESTPLCKPDPTNPNYVERFETFVAGFELANAYSELNDPVLQRKLLEQQSAELRAGSEEAHPMDEDFIRAIEFGMPPAGGVGIGIDRLIMILTNSSSIRDILLFPFMKPE